MKTSLPQNNPGGSVDAAPPTSVRAQPSSILVPFRLIVPEQKTPRLLSGRYLHMRQSGSAAMHEDLLDEDETDQTYVALTCGVVFLYVIDNSLLNRKYNDGRSFGETLKFISVPQDPAVGETLSDICAEHDSDSVIVEATATFQHSQLSVSSVTSGVSATIATLAKHCPPQIGWKAKTKRQYGSLEEDNPPRIARKQRQLLSWGRPRQEEVLLAWLTHALVPSDVHAQPAQDKKIAQDPCDSEVENASWRSISHVSVKRRKTAHVTSISKEERRSCWLTRPLRTTWTSGTPAQEDLPHSNSPLDHSRTLPVPAVRFTSAYASCFANAHRQPSIIRWKLA
ncbi:hypothetical protein DEU56DRAFT_798374 [Suillus clintonianus]|uniref:uncharacterized protein n=1 Tax=Suillus clintonianus TaxID=1904413 RepID=UPI001B884726|nr:uncharacterized protein DEU56DRAFT_798374 [Suillus clintonianus]KAG2140063.1 hypothetical protein DEU56DRAFT_798374 [Suillus clintonianus]